MFSKHSSGQRVHHSKKRALCLTATPKTGSVCLRRQPHTSSTSKPNKHITVFSTSPSQRYPMLMRRYRAACFRDSSSLACAQLVCFSLHYGNAESAAAVVEHRAPVLSVLSVCLCNSQCVHRTGKERCHRFTETMCAVEQR